MFIVTIYVEKIIPTHIYDVIKYFKEPKSSNFEAIYVENETFFVKNVEEKIFVFMILIDFSNRNTNVFHH